MWKKIYEETDRLIDVETEEFIIRLENNNTTDNEFDFSDCTDDLDDTLMELNHFLNIGKWKIFFIEFSLQSIFKM